MLKNIYQFKILDQLQKKYWRWVSHPWKQLCLQMIQGIISSEILEVGLPPMEAALPANDTKGSFPVKYWRWVSHPWKQLCLQMIQGIFSSEIYLI